MTVLNSNPITFNLRLIPRGLLIMALAALLTFPLGTGPALANIDDDKFDGNIFALYGGNGSLVPPRVELSQSLRLHKPALLVFFLDDSRDCKVFSTTVSQLQEYYGRAADFIPVNIDSIPMDSSLPPTEPGHYYRGYVPQTVIIDQSGDVVLDEVGLVAYEKVDDVFREVFDLLPREKSVELRRKPVNEINSEAFTFVLEL
ncbi:putative Thioredoxin-like protein [Limnospira indica PCC 8005]|uniref:Thioredoxin-like protein n=5 Tax=Oscillatoriales TaxID=1150 RepID=A0A9P1KCB1_9CYAN|nr:putative Thioredoxin-like protein [Limnospira indica PCC 8005]SMN35239.1 Thioredoxin-like protein [Arthrospira sp. SRM16]